VLQLPGPRNSYYGFQNTGCHLYSVSVAPLEHQLPPKFVYKPMQSQVLAHPNVHEASRMRQIVSTARFLGVEVIVSSKPPPQGFKLWSKSERASQRSHSNRASTPTSIEEAQEAIKAYCPYTIYAKKKCSPGWLSLYRRTRLAPLYLTS
jgi:hypothetical protein